MRVHVLHDRPAAAIVGAPAGEGTFPEGDPRAHNCDAMGCGSVGPHVLAWVTLEPHVHERLVAAVKAADERQRQAAEERRRRAAEPRCGECDDLIALCECN